MNRDITTALALLGAILCAAPAAAVVADSAAAGFTVTIEQPVTADPGRAYEALTAGVAAWWSSDHTWSGDAANLSLDARAGGLFREALPDGGSVEHMRVVYAAPGRQLRMVGGLGPLQGMAVRGSLTVTLEPAGAGTLLTLTYAVSGYAPEGLQGIAPAVDRVLAEQMARLAAHLAP